MLPNLCELPTDPKELLTDCLKLRVDGKLLYLPGICFSKDFHGLDFTPSELYRDFQEMAEIYFATGASVRKGKYRVDQKREVRKASGQELQIPFVVAHEAKASMNVEELFESPFHSNVFPEELHTVLKETFGEIQTPQIIRILDLPFFMKFSICKKLTYINNISHRSGSDLKKSYVPLGQQIIRWEHIPTIRTDAEASSMGRRSPARNQNTIGGPRLYIDRKKESAHWCGFLYAKKEERKKNEAIFYLFLVV